MNPDHMNALFEIAGGAFVMLNVRALWRDRRVRGVSWVCVAFFAGWGYWNLWYYPAIGQWASFTGAAGVAIANTIWLCLLGWFSFVQRVD